MQVYIGIVNCIAIVQILNNIVSGDTFKFPQRLGTSIHHFLTPIINNTKAAYGGSSFPFYRSNTIIQLYIFKHMW